MMEQDLNGKFIQLVWKDGSAIQGVVGDVDGYLLLTYGPRTLNAVQRIALGTVKDGLYDWAQQGTLNVFN